MRRTTKKLDLSGHLHRNEKEVLQKYSTHLWYDSDMTARLTPTHIDKARFHMLCHSFLSHCVCLLVGSIVPSIVNREEGHVAEAAAESDGCQGGDGVIDASWWLQATKGSTGVCCADRMACAGNQHAVARNEQQRRDSTLEAQKANARFLDTFA